MSIPRPRKKLGLYINGQFVQTQASFVAPSPLANTDSFSELELAMIDPAEPGDGEILEAALCGLQETFEQIRKGFFPLPDRLAFLQKWATRISDHRENLAQLLTNEIGKPIDLARDEIDRGLDTLRNTIAESALLLGWHDVPKGFSKLDPIIDAQWHREPRGPMLAITPFNFPINLVLHKIAPAIAAGCPVLLKPSEKAQLSALALVDHAHAAGLPPGLLNLVQVPPLRVHEIMGDPRIKQISFTGSLKVGLEIQRNFPLKPKTLELGQNGICFATSTTNIPALVTDTIRAAFSFAGQSCISTQNLVVDTSIYESVKEALCAAFAGLKLGDPRLEGVICGPVINQQSRDRIEALIKSELEQKKVRVLHELKSAFGSAYLLESLTEQPLESDICKLELFGPALTMIRARERDFASIANAQDCRLQCAIYSQNQEQLNAFTREADFASIVSNGPTNMRLDAMPYTARGLGAEGTEGPRFTLEQITQTKLNLAKKAL